MSALVVVAYAPRWAFIFAIADSHVCPGAWTRIDGSLPPNKGALWS